MKHSLNIQLALVFATGILIPAAALAYNEPVSTFDSMPTQLTEQQYFTTFDADRSGGLDQDEYASMNTHGHIKGEFSSIDLNGDGRLSLAELEGIESHRMSQRLAGN